MTEHSSSSLSPARRIAFQVLQMVERGQYASDALRALSSQISSRDAGLAAQIVFGSLRFQAQLDYLIFHYGRRRVEMLDAAVVIALRMAIFQLCYLERIPAHAAVHDSVELVKMAKRAAAGLANALLRKVRRAPVKWPDRATEFSCPEWLIQRWTAHFGDAMAVRIARAALSEPTPYIRVPPGAAPPAGLTLEPTAVSGCFRVLPHSGEPQAAADGFFETNSPPGRAAVRFQDIGSQAVLARLDLQPGHSYLDLCAAPGNKTLQALETPLSMAVACDTSLRRLQTVPRVCHRVVLDGTQSLPFNQKFDRIFIDAPCSGTGTFGRNPEIKWRVQKDDFKVFGARQRRLVEAALPLLTPTGKLLYATCSLEREENEDVVRQVLASSKTVELESEGWLLPGSEGSGSERFDTGDGFYGALFQHR